ncbi:sigma factor domain family protein, partial [Edwardsiella tarda ATCC 23685]
DAGVKMDSGIIAKYISRLAGIPPSSVDEMQPADLNTISWDILGFFLGTSAQDNS